MRDYVSPHHCYRTDGNWFLMKFKRHVPTACGVRFARQNQYPIRLIIAPIPIRIHWALKQTTVAILAAPACRLNEIPTSKISHLLVGFESVGSAAIKICQGFSRKKGVVLSGLSRRYRNRCKSCNCFVDSRTRAGTSVLIYRGMYCTITLGWN